MQQEKHETVKDQQNQQDHQVLYEAGVEKVPLSYVLLENGLILAQLVLGLIIMLPLRIAAIPIASLVYAIFAIAMLGFVLRKQLCASCTYYGKMCHCGWGKLSSKMYPQGIGNQSLGGKLAGMTWGMLMILPVIGWGSAWLFGLITLTEQLPLLAAFVVVSGINGAMHVIDCRKCKMRYICPGSAANKSS